MWHANDKEGDEEGGAEEGSGKAGPRVKMGCHGAEGRRGILTANCRAHVLGFAKKSALVVRRFKWAM